MSNERLDAIKARAAAATEGPWETVRVYDNGAGSALDISSSGTRQYSNTWAHSGSTSFKCEGTSGNTAILVPQSGSVTELGNWSTCECCNEIDRLSDAIAVVLELHEPDGDYCGECSIHDAVTYPCPTVVAIRTALGEGEK